MVFFASSSSLPVIICRLTSQTVRIPSSGLSQKHFRQLFQKKPVTLSHNLRLLTTSPTWRTDKHVYDGKQDKESNETHGQPAHSFGSSMNLEQAANRFDIESSSHHYQQDLSNSHVDAYNHAPSVNLHACMQSQVPEPYGKSPSHLNMPNGGARRNDKYVQGQISGLSSKREYATVAGLSPADTSSSLDEHGNPTYVTAAEIFSSPCPQGIQGEDCAQFKLWLSNCLEHGSNVECERLANEYIAGRKSLAQVFAEYELEIKKTVKVSKSSDSRSQ